MIEQDTGDDDLPPASLTFWSDAVKLRLRTQAGYALIEEKDVTSADGTQGHQLRFGKDQGSEPYIYWVTLFRTEKYLHVVEAGGKKALFESNQAAIETALAGYEVKR